MNTTSIDRSAATDALEAISLQNHTNSPLLRLPAEIRNQIYDYVFSNKSFQICYGCRPPRLLVTIRDVYHEPHAHYPRQLLSTLEVCRQIHSEARLMVFGAAGTRLQGYHETVKNYFSGLTKSALALDQMSSVKRLVLEFEDSDLYSNKNDIALDLPTEQLGCIALLSGLEDIVIRIGCHYPSHNDGTEFEDSIASLRSQVVDACRQHGRTVNIKIIVHLMGDHYLL